MGKSVQCTLAIMLIEVPESQDLEQVLAIFLNCRGVS